jgi:tetratricopeptide (TPR) repeat protein
VAITLAVLGCYAPGLSAPLLFDDPVPFLEAGRWGFPPSLADLAGSPLASRPLVALTLSATHALFGPALPIHHLVNVLIHLAATLLFHGLLNRTLALPVFGAFSPGRKGWLALLAALAWGLHPLNTQAVTYLIQRGECLMGMFLFGGLYAAVRSWTSTSSRTWQALFLACLALGAMSKESIAALPPLLVLHHWTFMEPGLAAFWRRNRILTLGTLALGLGGAALLSRHLASFYHHVLPFGLLEYAANQGKVILHYLSLAFWPGPLCFDYMLPAEEIIRVAPQAGAVLLLLAGAVWLIVRRSPLGFFAGFFFLTLAPTSSFLPIRDLCVEHRMYLPLAGLIGFLALAVNALVTRIAGSGAGADQKEEERGGPVSVENAGGACGDAPAAAQPAKEPAQQPSPQRAAQLPAMSRLFKCPPGLAAALALAILIITALGARTVLRNLDYAAGEQHMWRDVLAKSPDNPRAHWIVGRHLAFHGQPGEAIAHLSRAFSSSGLLTTKDLAQAGDLLAGLLFNTGRQAEALAVYQRSIELDPEYVFSRLGYGQALLSLGRTGEAAALFRSALAQRPNLAHGLFYLAQAEAALGRLDEAARDMHASLSGVPLDSGLSAPRMPDRAETFFHLGRFLAASGRRAEALAALAQGLGESPSPALRKQITDLAAALSAPQP